MNGFIGMLNPQQIETWMFLEMGLPQTKNQPVLHISPTETSWAAGARDGLVKEFLYLETWRWSIRIYVEDIIGIHHGYTKKTTKNADLNNKNDYVTGHHGDIFER